MHVRPGPDGKLRCVRLILFDSASRELRHDKTANVSCVQLTSVLSHISRRKRPTQHKKEQRRNSGAQRGTNRKARALRVVHGGGRRSPVIAWLIESVTKAEARHFTELCALNYARRVEWRQSKNKTPLCLQRLEDCACAKKAAAREVGWGKTLWLENRKSSSSSRLFVEWVKAVHCKTRWIYRNICAS